MNKLIKIALLFTLASYSAMSTANEIVGNSKSHDVQVQYKVPKDIPMVTIKELIESKEIEVEIDDSVDINTKVVSPRFIYTLHVYYQTENIGNKMSRNFTPSLKEIMKNKQVKESYDKYHANNSNENISLDLIGKRLVYEVDDRLGMTVYHPKTGKIIALSF
ncbi:MAG: hypothetical protein Q4E16_04415 [Neisseria sp.]|nr:hypothetical protein [Neisseria sp.]